MSERLGKILAGLVTGLSAVSKRRHRAHTRLHAAQRLAQRHTIDTRHGPMVLVASHPREIQYARYFATREPETLAWIDNFAVPCRFWDIGANVGMFTLYAGLRPGVAVAAFEPAAASYAALCRNIDANSCAAEVRAYCLAFANRTKLDQLNLSDVAAGSVFNVFGGTSDCYGEPIRVASRQGAIGFSIDQFRRVFGLPAPNYLKIDVDSVEEEILTGAAATLRDPELRSVLIEIEEAETARNVRLVGLLREAGLDLSLVSEGNRGGGVNAIFDRNATDHASSPILPAGIRDGLLDQPADGSKRR